MQKNNELLLEATRRPIFGWTENYFNKNIASLVVKQIKKEGAKEFNDFFISKKVFDFKPLFKTKPEFSLNGSGVKMLLKLKYTLELDKKTLESLLIGIKDKGQDGKYQIKGLLFNPSFRNEFEIEEVDEDTSESSNENETKNSDVDDDEEFGEFNEDTFESVYYNIINEGLFSSFRKKKKEAVFAPFNEDQARNLIGGGGSISVIFELGQIKYCENHKKKDNLNVNHVTEMSGIAYLEFLLGGKTFTIPVSSENGVVWKQKRTEGMNPPKPIKDELKQIWKNPNEGFGVAGLAAKKLVGGIAAVTLGSMGGNVVQEGGFDVSFINSFSESNMSGEKVSNSNNEKSGNVDIIEIIENKLNDEFDDVYVNANKDNEFTCKIIYKDKKINFTIITTG